MADSTRDNESITEIVPAALGKYLLEAVNDLEEYYPEFPQPNRSIEMPSVSLLFSSPSFSPDQCPNPVSPVDPLAIQNSQADVNWIVGQYDGNLQLDLWARNKEERDDLFDAIFNALNPNIRPMGLTLELEDYFNVLCDYLYVGHDIEDSEITSQTDEWRVTFRLLVTCKAVRKRKEFIIEESELQLSTAPTSGDTFEDA